MSQMKARYTKTVVGMRKLSVNLHYYDVEIYDEGIAGFFMWRTTTVRTYFHKLMDFFKRMSRKVDFDKIEEQHHEYSFFIPWSDIQGVVTYDNHNEIMIRTDKDLYTFLFRRENLFFFVKENYPKMVEVLKEKVPDKVFSRDAKKIKESIYEGYGERKDLIPQMR